MVKNHWGHYFIILFFLKGESIMPDTEVLGTTVDPKALKVLLRL